MKKNNYLKLLLYSFWSSPVVAWAQTAPVTVPTDEPAFAGPVTEADWKEIFSSSTFIDSEASATLIIGNIFAFLFGLATVFAIFYTLMNGFKMITGGGNEEKYTEAKKGLIWGTVGIFITVAAVIIARMVVWVAANPQTF